MATTVAALRACGARRVALVTDDGTFEGRILQEHLGDASIVIMFETVDRPAEPLVIALDAIVTLVRR